MKPINLKKLLKVKRVLRAVPLVGSQMDSQKVEKRSKNQKNKTMKTLKAENRAFKGVRITTEEILKGENVKYEYEIGFYWVLGKYFLEEIKSEKGAGGIWNHSVKILKLSNDINKLLKVIEEKHGVRVELRC
jgi:hypothetical protein